MAVLHVYVDLVASEQDAAGGYPGQPPTWRPAGRAARTSTGSSRRSATASAADYTQRITQGGAVDGREVLAFDLYGPLVDPIAVAGELSQLLGESTGTEAAGLWRGKQLEYSFRLTAMGRYEDFRWVTARALDFALASLGAGLTTRQAERLGGLYDQLR